VISNTLDAGRDFKGEKIERGISYSVEKRADVPVFSAPEITEEYQLTTIISTRVEYNSIMSGQRSADNEGTSVAAGCALNEGSPRGSPVRRDDSILAAEENLLFAWGRGEDGQLGLGDTNDQDEPTYVDALRGVSVQQIACGSGHTVVLTTEGNVYTWYVYFWFFLRCMLRRNLL